MIGADETVNKSFFSSEYSVIESRPYVELTYTPNVTLNYTELSMIVGETKTLTATTVPSGLDVVWSTSAPEVATVDETGVVTIVGNGDVIITATVGEESVGCALTVRPPTVTLDHSEIELVIGESQTLTATTFPPGAPLEWQSSNLTIASVDSNGVVTGQNAGTTKIMVMYMDSFRRMYIDECIVHVRLKDGSYFLENVQTGYYADIKGPTMADGTTIHQWSFHGEPSQKWYFTHLGEGYYSIHSRNADTPYYLGVKNDSTAVDTDVVLRTGTLTDGMKWKIEFTKNGAYKIIPKTGEAKDYVLATSTSSATNGEKLLQGDYADNTSYRDEWLISTYILAINAYYDNAFEAEQYVPTERIDQLSELIDVCLWDTFDIRVYHNEPIGVTSTPDQCKLSRGLQITGSTSKIMCPANPSNVPAWCDYYEIRKSEYVATIFEPTCENCTSWYSIYHDFIKMYPGTDTDVSVLFTGNTLYDDNGASCNRSFMWYNNGICIQQLERRTDFLQNVSSTYIHEIAHSLGAPDHYHEPILDGGEVCRSGKLCCECGEEGIKRVAPCIMGEGLQVEWINFNGENVFCTGCFNDITDYLKSKSELLVLPLGIRVE